jgi:hypothetical protein
MKKSTLRTSISEISIDSDNSTSPVKGSNLTGRV